MKNRIYDPEEWREVDEFGGDYSISSHGRFRSNERLVLYPNATLGVADRVGKIMCRTTNKYGHLLVQPCQNGVIKNRSVHIMVLEAFHGPRPARHFPNWADGDTTNARADNLVWGTVRQGKPPGNPKLARNDVLYVRASKRKAEELAGELHVCIETVRNARAGRTYAWVK